LSASDVVDATFSVTASDGVTLFVREYWPAGTIPDRTLICVHGACSHGGRIVNLAEAAARRGWRVFVPDLRGHGHSGGVSVHVSRFSEYVDDLETHWKHFQWDPARTAVLGQSTGGLIAARFAETTTIPFAALVLMSPLFRLVLPVSPLILAIGRVLSVIAPRIRFRSRIKPSQLSRDTDAQQAVRADTLIRRSVTAGWFVAVERGMQEAVAAANQVEQPLLVLQGSRDQVVDPVATVEWAEATRSRDCTVRVLPDHLHELLSESDQQETLAVILDWLDARLPAGSVQPAATE
jgi:alpha-beta hydrolase superfamily lysophospholipase